MKLNKQKSNKVGKVVILRFDGRWKVESPFNCIFLASGHEKVYPDI